MVVMKFGGTSVADAAAIRRLAGIVRKQRAAAEGKPEERGAPGPVVVVSALSGVTDRLLDLARQAGGGEVDRAQAALGALHARHRDVALVVENDEQRALLLERIDQEFAKLSGLASALGMLHELSARSLDAVAAVGELLSSLIVTEALASIGLPTVWVDARQVLVTDQEHAGAQPLMKETTEACSTQIGPLLNAGLIPVIGGFVGATSHGVTTTLGRGGSDYSASIFGACLQAREIQIWTDVDGMLTADPRIVEGVRLVPELSFAEASELAYFGAKVLHPSTIQPAVAQGIPVRILNSRRPEIEGTLITASPGGNGTTLTALACKRDVTVIEITSSRMLMAYGFLRRLFEVFEQYKTPVDVVSTSEVSVSVTIDDRRNLPALVEALSHFAEVSVEHEMALVCAVSENLRRDTTLFGRALAALDGIPLRMVSQAASRRNLTFVIPQSDLVDAMSRLHQRFFTTAEAMPERAEAQSTLGPVDVQSASGTPGGQDGSGSVGLHSAVQ